jgi:hypothetical protein
MDKRMKPIYRIALLFWMTYLLGGSCTKPILIPNGPTSRSNLQTIVFYNVTIFTNADYVFNIPQITASVLDSGSIEAYYRSVLVIRDTWYPLPYIPSYTGDSALLYVSGFAVGGATLANFGLKTKTYDYRFDIAASK